jgi:archaeal flagellin FlaB
MKKLHRAVFPMYNTGIVIFFTIAVILVIIFVNIGLSVNNTQKAVVDKAVDEIDERLAIAGKISAFADISSHKIMATATPVKTVSDGAVNVDPQIMDVSYKLVKSENYVISYDNIYVGSIRDRTYDSLVEAVEDAKAKGLIDNNPYVDIQKPTSTRAFVYWIINQNFDNYIDNDELAVLAIVYADRDRPSSGEQLFIDANVPEGYVLRIEQDVPNISSKMVNFGGIINES